jgi:hypothetical protein
MLVDALGRRGFVESTTDRPGAVEAFMGNRLLGRSVAIPFVHGAETSISAALIYARLPGGTVVTWVIVHSDSAVLYGLRVNAAGTRVVRRNAPELEVRSSFDDSRASVAEPESAASAVTQLECALLTSFACGLAVGLARWALTGLICGATGGVACALAVGWLMLGTLGTGACIGVGRFFCSNDYVRCSCDGSCYSSRQVGWCQDDCRVSLGCFTAICQPQFNGSGCNKFVV